MRILAAFSFAVVFSFSLLAQAHADDDRISFRSYDGTQLSGKLYIAKKPKALLLIVHGIQSHSDWYRSGDNYAEAGITSLVFDRRGAGRSDGTRGHVDAPEQLIWDLAAARERLRKEDPTGTLPIHVLANSLGYYIATSYVHDHPGSFASLILTTPAAAVRPEADYSAAEQMKILVAKPKVYFDTPLKDEFFVEPGFWLDWIRLDPLATHHVTAQFLKSMLKLKLEAKKASVKLDVPMLLLLANRDEITDNELVKSEFYQSYVGPKELHEFDSKHFLDFGPSAKEVSATVIKWILSH